MNLFAYIPTILSTPLLKIPLLVSEAILNYITTTPPNPPPPPVQTKKYDGHGILTPIDDMHMKIISLGICAIAVAEAVAVLAQAVPSSFSDSILSVLALGSPVPTLSLQITPRYLLGAAIALIGGGVRVWAYRTLGRFFTWQLAVKSDHNLVTDGPYAWVRHPSYTGFVMAPIGNLIMATSAGAYFTEVGWRGTGWGKVYLAAVFGYIGLVGVQVLTRVSKEDAVLRENFGEEWEAWAKKTPYRLIPYIY
ncbi:ICMT-domain-containing protein [Trametes versicolor FP-101664 SS1]|uniref:ICMT-domain-containing protein n=1 Tax=Trametes versicolor (strain FP-101664) TaxID=717944 RepID=UPI000462240A|nr:ICMT-domain-containing protein [Trametes versicolor FP-101664 SS1]EIW55737.1 ICMT-domain-containing protein [Trametes versicolor FP-101664 SS1]